MEYTEILQSCTSAVVNGIFKYRIGLSVQNKGDLPHTNIFAYALGTADNPDTDTFSRIANVADLQELPTSRETAIEQSASEFLLPTMEVYYEDLNVAIQAKDTMASRVNELVNTWVTYQDDFIDTDGRVLFYPTADPATETALIGTYKNAKSARISAEADVAAADAEVSTTKQKMLYEQKIYDIYRTACVVLTRVYNPATPTCELLTFKGKITTIGTEADTYFTAPLSASMDELRSLICNPVSTQAGISASASADYETALDTKKEAAATLKEAQAQEDAALAAVLAVCATFDPDSV